MAAFRVTDFFPVAFLLSSLGDQVPFLLSQ